MLYSILFLSSCLWYRSAQIVFMSLMNKYVHKNVHALIQTWSLIRKIVRLEPRENMPDKTCTETYVFPENILLKKSRKILAYFDFLPCLRVCYTSNIWTERLEALVNLDWFQLGRIWGLDSLRNVSLKLQWISTKLFVCLEV